MIRLLVGIGASALLLVAFRRWQEELALAQSAPGGTSLPPAAPAPEFTPAAPSLPAPLYDAVTAMVPMGVSATGRSFIKSQEGFSLTPYADSGGQSIFWGHKIQPGEHFAGTMDEANATFAHDIGIVEETIAETVRVPLTQGQYDALADFIYNTSKGNPLKFSVSTLLRKLNARDYAGAAAEFKRWVYSQGRVNTTLQARRDDEQQMFQGASA